MKGKLVLIGSLTAVVMVGALAVAGVVRAQTPTPGGSGGPNAPAAGGAGGDFKARIDGFLNNLAQNLGLPRSTLDSALKTTAKQQLDQAVSAGRLTQDQADRIKQRIDSGQGPFGFGGFSGFGRHRGPGGGGPGGAAFAACASPSRDALTSALGVSADDLKQARQNGQTISQVAQAHGKTLQDVQTAIGTAMKGCLDKQVQQGSLTQDQEQQILQRIQNHPFPGDRRGGDPPNGTPGN